MAIDKVKLAKTINDLGDKIRTDSEAVGKLDRVRSCLNVVTPDERIDERTGKLMTNAVRQKIYDDNMADATALLA